MTHIDLVQLMSQLRANFGLAILIVNVIRGTIAVYLWEIAAALLDAPTDFTRVVDFISIDSLWMPTGKPLGCYRKSKELVAYRVHLDMQHSLCWWEQE